MHHRSEDGQWVVNHVWPNRLREQIQPLAKIQGEDIVDTIRSLKLLIDYSIVKVDSLGHGNSRDRGRNVAKARCDLISCSPASLRIFTYRARRWRRAEERRASLILPSSPFNTSIEHFASQHQEQCIDPSPHCFVKVFVTVPRQLPLFSAVFHCFRYFVPSSLYNHDISSILLFF
jgi:hypothetical protein